MDAVVPAFKEMKSQSVGTIITIVLKIIDVICYVTALVISYLLFCGIFVIDDIFGKIILAILLLLATFVLWQKTIFWLFRSIRMKGRPLNMGNFCHHVSEVIKKFRTGALLLVSFRLFVLNVLYSIFPILLFVFSGFLLLACIPQEYFTDLSTYISNLCISFGFIQHPLTPWTVPNFKDIGRVATLFGVTGILLALFRYYVESQKKIPEYTVNAVIQDIERMIMSSYSYMEFEKWISATKGKSNSVAKAVSHVLDDTEDLSRQCQTICDQLQTSFSKANSKVARKVILRNLRLYASLPQHDSEYLYNKLEKSNLSQFKVTESDLYFAYNAYFLEHCFDKIRDAICNNYDLSECGRILITNVNFIDDSGASFVKFSSVVNFYDFLSNDADCCAIAEKKLSTATDYRDELMFRIYKTIMREIFIDYLRSSADEMEM